MKSFTKAFLIIGVFTVFSWLIAFGSAVLAGDQPFPKATFARIEKGLEKDSSEIKQSQKSSLEGIKSLEVQVGSADIDLIKSDAQELTADLDGYGPKDTKLEIIRKGSVLAVKVETKSHFSWNFGSHRSLRLRVAIPEKYHNDLALKSGSGNIEAVDLELAKLEMKVGSGEVKLNDVKAKSTEAKTGSGDVSLSKVAAQDLQLHTGSGDISINEVTARNAEARSGSGSVTVRLGSVKDWTATARTGSGDIEIDLPGTEKSKSSHFMKAGQGNNQLNVHTGSGDIKISL